MHNAEKIVQRRIVLALAHFCSPGDQEAIFVDNNGTPNNLFFVRFDWHTTHITYTGASYVVLLV